LTTKLATLLLFLSLQTHVFSQSKPLENGVWNGKKCAVVLTYDDALNVHLDNAIPLLDSLLLKGTFYISAYAEGCKNRLSDWRRSAQTGHELGNHTLYHPCESKPDRPWLNPENDLKTYTLKRISEEIKMTNVLLEAIDGKAHRTFAYTCGDTTIGVDRQVFMNSLKTEFIAARGVFPALQTLDKVNLYNVDTYPINGETGEQLIDLVKKAREKNALLVFLFHGVGGEHGLNVDLAAHRQLLLYLKANEADIWVAPMLKVAEFIKAKQ
jgi:peptidoglycan/xylan/chitin deacetylase (PgdA/CDA1 family)